MEQTAEITKKPFYRRGRAVQDEAERLCKSLMDAGVFLIDDLLEAFSTHFKDRPEIYVDRSWVTSVRYKLKNQMKTNEARDAALREFQQKSAKTPAQSVIEGVLKEPSIQEIKPSVPSISFSKDEALVLMKAVMESSSLKNDVKLSLISKLTSATQ